MSQTTFNHVLKQTELLNITEQMELVIHLLQQLKHQQNIYNISQPSENIIKTQSALTICQQAGTRSKTDIDNSIKKEREAWDK
jgi:hypothetical protein